MQKQKQYKSAANPYRAAASDKVKYTRKEAIHWVGGNLDLGNKLLATLCDNGLNPTDRVLEIGPGCFRCSGPLINYLDGNYHCVEGDSQLIKIGLKEVLPDKLVQQVRYAISWNFDVSSFGPKRFDFIVAQGVICHMPESELKKMLKVVARSLSFNSKCWLSFIEGKRTDKNPYHWTNNDLTKFCRENVLDFHYLGSWEHPRELPAALIKHRLVIQSPRRSPIIIAEAIRDIINDKSVCDLGCAEGDNLLSFSRFASSIIGLERDIKRGKMAIKRGLKVILADYFLSKLPSVDVFYCWPNDSADCGRLAQKIIGSKQATYLILAADMNLENEKDDLINCHKRWGGEFRTVHFDEGPKNRQNGEFGLLIIRC